jgi:predicted nucleotidyltransferase
VEAKELLKKIAKSLSKKGIEYMIIGGQAVLIYGEPRLTKDIDITLGINVDGLEKILEIVRCLFPNPKNLSKKHLFFQF